MPDLNQNAPDCPLPSYETIFDIKKNDLHTIEQSCVTEWIKWYGELSLMPDEKYKLYGETTLFAAYFYPFCDELARYENLVKIVIGFFVIDDHTELEWGDISRDENTSNIVYGQFKHLLDKLVTDQFIPMTSWRPYILAFYTLFESICTKYNNIQKHRLVYMWKQYIEGNEVETKIISAKKKLTSIKQLEEIRTKTIGIWPCIQLIEFAENIYLKEEDWSDTKIKLLGNLIVLNTAYVNDLYSFKKEIIERDGDKSKMFNFVSLITELDNCDVSVAMDKVVNTMKQQEQDIKIVYNEIISDPECSEEKRLFANRMLYILTGNFICHILLNRYR